MSLPSPDTAAVASRAAEDRVPLPALFGIFLKLGLISFGGPVAHLGYFLDEFVKRRRWLTDEAFGDLVALCQFLPGPASSQLVFAIGMRKGRLPGAVLASLGFLLPSAALMIAFAYGVSAFGGLGRAGWLHGLKLAAVAVVAQAVWTMARRLCPDLARLLLAAGAAALTLLAGTALGQVASIAAGALAGWAVYRRQSGLPADDPAPAAHAARGHRWAVAVLAAFALLLVALPSLAALDGGRAVRIFDSFYRAGSLVFGGGHVVLPLLRAEVVPTGWISDERFLAGYGAAQALPGPLFSFAAYLGAVITGGSRAWLGGLWCLFAIFLPAWLLIGGALPFWEMLRSRAGTRAALKGANASVVGVLFAAFCNPVCTQGITGVTSVVVAAAAFGLLQSRRVPAWAVVLLCALAGQWLPGI